MYQVPDTYVPGISRQKSIRTYVVVRMIPTFRPWTHTSDDSYIYQLSLVVATATVFIACEPHERVGTFLAKRSTFSVDSPAIVPAGLVATGPGRVP